MVKDCNNIQLIDLKTDVTGTDCADILKKFPMTSGKDGVYNITIAYNKRKQVFCDMSTDNGGWTVLSLSLSLSLFSLSLPLSLFLSLSGLQIICCILFTLPGDTEESGRIS